MLWIKIFYLQTSSVFLCMMVRVFALHYSLKDVPCDARGAVTRKISNLNRNFISKMGKKEFMVPTILAMSFMQR